MAHGSTAGEHATPRSAFYDQGRFGRMFPTLPPFAADTQSIRDALVELGAPGGPMDAGDDLSDPITLITRPGQEREQPEQPDDDRRLHLPRPVPRPRHDVRPDLEPRPAAGPRVDPQLPHPGARPRQRLRRRAAASAAPLRPDRRRRPDDAARRGDPRLGGRHGRRRRPASTCPATARASPSSAIPATTRTSSSPSSTWPSCGSTTRWSPTSSAELGTAYTAQEIFAEAQRVVRWHYQWLVLHEFLPATVGDEPDRRHPHDGPQHFYDWRNDPFIPVEFSVAAYRFGHSQVRPSYRGQLRHRAPPTRPSSSSPSSSTPR